MADLILGVLLLFLLDLEVETAHRLCTRPVGFAGTEFVPIRRRLSSFRSTST
jgi:hypothetical protein